jgi:hypothetical protein
VQFIRLKLTELSSYIGRPAEFNADHLIDRFDQLLSLVIKPIPNRSEPSSDAGSSPQSTLCSGPERHA